MRCASAIHYARRLRDTHTYRHLCPVNASVHQHRPRPRGGGETAVSESSPSGCRQGWAMPRPCACVPREMMPSRKREPCRPRSSFLHSYSGLSLRDNPQTAIFKLSALHLSWSVWISQFRIVPDLRRCEFVTVRLWLCGLTYFLIEPSSRHQGLCLLFTPGLMCPFHQVLSRFVVSAVRLCVIGGRALFGVNGGVTYVRVGRVLSCVHCSQHGGSFAWIRARCHYPLSSEYSNDMPNSFTGAARFPNLCRALE